MKKIVSLLLTAIILLLFVCPASASTNERSYGGYKHVFIIGIDGAGRFIKDADTPNFDRIFKDNAVDYYARSEIYTISAQNWASILTGVSQSKHDLNNTITEMEERTSQTQFPTIFTYARRAMPDAELASFVNWSNINFGIIENDIGVTKVSVGDDAALTDRICSYFDEGNSPALFFVQYDSVDHAGHEYGSASEEYLKQIETVDGYLGKVFDSIEKNGLLDDSLFIIVADHGHTAEGGHGLPTMRETNVTLAVRGKHIVKNGKLDVFTRNRDVAAIALHALGIKRPDNMTSRIPAHLFYDNIGQMRPIWRDFDDAYSSTVSWFKNTLKTIFD